MPELLYTMKEVAKILKTNVDYVHRLRRAGLLPVIKVGSYKVRVSALESFLARYEGQDITDPEHITAIERGA